MTDRDAFVMLLLKHEVEIRAFVASLVRDPHGREDVFQEVALALWQQADRYDPQRPFGAWARGIAVNKVLQRRDQERRFPLALPPEGIRAVAAAFDRTDEARSNWLEALHDCLKRLSEADRQFVKLRYEERTSGDEIARRTNGTPGAVYQALWRIRAALAECIRRRLAHEEGI